ncbi:uncharacterized protein MAM_05255 [Metarhizium album ARSEF 1941]|uniref:Uncharacterized protein n=1 Tax=Metarhizium album (strain ARSEF 1941) TaxID=1081103 RepID=A0A0B2WSV8_METAS|nr:uncharacterized protein MAM_05255 [Metarhizium album ARSEF 1941]KHN96699.1 hypothetical protein MAM_05255 [Metarhizium album ARSEF 1941]
MVYDWDAHQETCYRLYIDEGRSLEDIMDHMKTVHKFTPSKRAFQTQFRRWNFPPKQRPAYQNDRLVSRIKELWEKNLAQKEMLRILNEEDGFDIKARELVRVRARNRWLLRAPNGDKGRAPLGDDDDDQTEGEELPSSSVPMTDAGSPAAPRNVLSATGSDTQQDSDRDMRAESASSSRRKRRRARQSATGGESGSLNRFPSEMTLDEARAILDLDVSIYRALRTQFQQICQEDNIFKKTTAGTEKWDAAKTKLVRQMPQIHGLLWSNSEKPEVRQLALDIICTDVTKRMRTMEKRMTLAEAKNVLGINPEEARDMRTAFYLVLADSGFTCKSDATPQQWEDLKTKWGDKSALAKRIMMNTRTNGDEKQEQARAVEVLAKDIMKRLRDERGRKDTRRHHHQHLPISPAGSSQAGQLSKTSETGHPPSSPSNDQVALAEGNGNPNFDTMSDVSHISQMAFSPPSSSIGGHLPMSLQSQTSNLSDSRDGLPRSPRVLGSSPIPPGMGLESQMSSSLLLEANTQAAFMDQPYVQPQYAPPATSAPVFTQVQRASTACAIFLRFHPSSSSYIPSSNLWIATLTSHSVQELRQVAAAKFPGTACLRVEGVLKDGKGCELPLQIEEDQELSAYLAHLQGTAPTFNVQLVWETP